MAKSPLQLPNPGKQSGAHCPIVQLATLAFSELQSLLHNPQSMTVFPRGVPSIRSVHWEFDGQLVNPG